MYQLNMKCNKCALYTFEFRMLNECEKLLECVASVSNRFALLYYIYEDCLKPITMC